MTILFYSFLLLFIWNEFYYVKNKLRLDKNLKNKDIEMVTKSDVFFYFIRLIYWSFLILGLFTSMKVFFLILLSLRILQIPLFHIHRKTYIYYDNFLPVVSSILMVIILVIKLIS